MYKNGYNYRISEHNYSLQMEGLSREGHFEGVLTVVMKLLNIVQPHRTYFGEKDYQQFELIESMCKSFFMNINIISCKRSLIYILILFFYRHRGINNLA